VKITAPKPTMHVLYGQPDHLSTSYQTGQLVNALRRYFTLSERRFANMESGHYQTQLKRIWSNAIEPYFHQPPSDFVFYGNDGLADLRQWKATSVLYWYDAPWDWSANPPKPKQRRHWLRYQNVLCADHVFAVSAAQVEVARKLRPGREASVYYLPVGVDSQYFSPKNADANLIRSELGIPAKAVVIGYVGYIAGLAGRFAGQPLVEAASRMALKGSAHFLIVGFGPASEAFKRAVSARGLDSAFTFTGYVPLERLPSFIASMDICIDTLEAGFHSEARSETKLKQYMAMGRACVATAIGENCVDLDYGGCGCLAKPGDEGLLQGILELLNDPNRRTKLGAAARERAVSTYDWAVLAKKMRNAILA
jgi:glycosyltransferase involved in cell wall biosynthesis